MASKKVPVIIAIIVVLVTILPPLAGVYLDFFWFKNLGFQDIFTKVIWTQVWVGLVFGISFFIFQLINFFIAHKKGHKHKVFPLSTSIKVLIIAGISFFVGLAFRSFWETILLYMNQVAFKQYDPIFGLDLAFYIFSLPFFTLLVKFLMLTVGISLLVCALTYFLQGDITWFNISGPKDLPETRNVKLSFKMSRKVKTHLSFLGALFFALIAVYYYFKRYSVLYSEAGIVTGAGYTDVYVTLPVLTFLIILSVVIAAEFLIWPKLFRKKNIIPMTIGAFLVIAFLALTIVPGLVQYFKVLPNEFKVEAPFIQNNIKFTRLAYDLDNVEEVPFDISTLSSDVVNNNPGTFDNIRLWDHRPLKQTYNQLQEIRLYYDFNDVDMDRYTIDGDYRQVMLSARELNQDQLTTTAQTWVNKKLVFTHGMGVTLSPVNEFTSQGLPDLFVKDIPPTSIYPKLSIDRPQIYYGEGRQDYVITDTATKEFDYAKGDQNVYTNYEGDGGVEINSFWRKLLFTIRFADINILLTGDISPESKVLWNRNIQKRISRIAPFLTLDPDPYVVISDGKLFWIQDAYTTSSSFPYSAYTKFSDWHSINYIRNSVKVVIDAYDGDVSLYVSDPKDPIVNAYANMFPSLFTNMDDIPSDLASHVRYPEQILNIQSNMYRTYHMNDSNVFYNQEDMWDIPGEVYGEGSRITMNPYYIIMRLPGEDEEEFVLMTPFTPHNKDNMIGWMAARSDDKYGKLIVYKFPKERLIYGPMQVEARIDQDATISEQLTLWDQRGSTVLRGNLLVIPVDDSVFYVEPLYIIAEQSQLPELKRIIVSDGEKVFMEQTFEEALGRLFDFVPSQDEDTLVDFEDYKGQDELVGLANQYYQNIDSAMKSGDWSGIGQNLDKLGHVLAELRGETGEDTENPITVDTAIDGIDPDSLQ